MIKNIKLVNRRYIKADGKANKRPSIRSSMPPWPGIIDEESFTPAALLNLDSAKSPNCEEIAIITANAIELIIPKDCKKKWAITMKVIIDAENPAIDPSHVFLGLTEGNSFRRPNDFPIKYAAESLAQTDARRAIVK